MAKRSGVLTLAGLCVLLGAVLNAAPEEVFYLSLEDDLSITATGGEIVSPPALFIPGADGNALAGNGSTYARWNDATTGALFEGWDNEAGVTVDLYFSGDHWSTHSGDSGLWSIVRRSADRYIILSVQNGKMRHLFRDAAGEYKYHITGVPLANNVTYRLTVRQANGQMDVYLDGGTYRNETPVFSATDLPAGYTWDFVPAGGSPAREMNVARRAIFDGKLQSGEWVDEIRVYNGFYSPAELDIPYAMDPDPADGAINVPADVVLTWNPPLSRLMDEEPARYNVYFGAEPNELSDDFDFELVSGDQLETWYDPLADGVLDMLTDYYWRVDVIDPNHGYPIVYTGDMWTFTTVPPKATEPYPTDAAVNVEQNVILTWNSGYGAIAHDVYLGLDESLVAAGDAAVYMGRYEQNSYVCDLPWQTQYFWRVDEVFQDVPIPTPGDVWSFTTGTPECEYDMPGDINKDCVVDFSDLAMMAADWMACNLINGNCP